LVLSIAGFYRDTVTVRAALFSRQPHEFEALGAVAGRTHAELIAEYASRDLWLAWKGDRLVGFMHPWRRPDGKCALEFGPTALEAYAVLAAQVPGEVITTVDAADADVLDACEAAGFAPARIEDRYLIPVRAFDAPAPPGLRTVSAADTELDPLMELDTALREDVPGGAGWRPDADWFRRQNHDSPYFDPETYLVALDGTRHVGLMRIWNGPRPLPRLGLIGVLPDYRRRGLAKALIAQGFAVLAARGETRATAEADRTNTASTTLLSGLGGVVTGSDVELRRPAAQLSEA
jgi:GNAT superfamily N-acetyltransferase